MVIVNKNAFLAFLYWPGTEKVQSCLTESLYCGHYGCLTVHYAYSTFYWLVSWSNAQVGKLWPSSAMKTMRWRALFLTAQMSGNIWKAHRRAIYGQKYTSLPIVWATGVNCTPAERRTAFPILVTQGLGQLQECTEPQAHGHTGPHPLVQHPLRQNCPWHC